jgi:hypothetical protein
MQPFAKSSLRHLLGRHRRRRVAQRGPGKDHAEVSRTRTVPLAQSHGCWLMPMMPIMIMSWSCQQPESVLMMAGRRTAVPSIIALLRIVTITRRRQEYLRAIASRKSSANKLTLTHFNAYGMAAPCVWRRDHGCAPRRELTQGPLREVAGLEVAVVLRGSAPRARATGSAPGRSRLRPR